MMDLLPALAGHLRRFPIPSVPLAVFLVTIAVFWKTLEGGFLSNWDDGANFLQNHRYRGLGPANLLWMWTASHMGHYTPLAWMTFGLDFHLWGMNPAGYHLTNILLHALTAAAIYLLSRRLLSLFHPEGGPSELSAAAAFSALFFSLHPLRVESVAWLTERRDLLSAFFLVGATLAYLRSVALESVRWKSASWFLFAASLFSKAAGMPFPFVLLVLDVYPLRRPGKEGWARLLKEKVPFFLLSAACAAAAVSAQFQAGAAASLRQHGALARGLQALYGPLFYVQKTLVPAGLSPLYEIPVRFNPWAAPLWAGAVFTLGVTWVLFHFRRRWPAGLAAWAVYLLFLAPTAGFFQSGPQLVADRYSYLSCLGWAVMAGAGLFALHRTAGGARGGRFARVGAMGAAFLLLAGLATASHRQIRVWRSPDDLWRRVLAIRPHSPLGFYNTGFLRLEEGDLSGAEESFRQATEANPAAAEAWHMRGYVLLLQKELGEASRCLRRALDLKPVFAEAHNNLGLVLSGQGRHGDAIGYYQQALELDPEFAEACNNMATAYGRLDRRDEAEAWFRRALSLDPELHQARLNLALLLGAASAERPLTPLPIAPSGESVWGASGY